jgi:hypothetical protein
MECDNDADDVFMDGMESEIGLTSLLCYGLLWTGVHGCCVD